MSEMLKHLLMCYKYGTKTLYYFNTYDGQGEINIDKFVPDVVESTEVAEADCESCTI